jgi:glycosyltransferase 2 family protein
VSDQEDPHPRPPGDGALPLLKPNARPSIARILIRAALFAVALFALWNTLRHAELAKVAALIALVGAPFAIVPAPYLAALLLHAVAFGRILTILGHEVRYGRLLSVVISCEAVLMTLPGGAAASDSLHPYLLKSRCGIPLPDGLAATAAKKALIVLANALYIGIALAGGVEYLRAASPALIGAPGLSWLVLAAAIGLFIGAMLMGKALLSGALATRSLSLLRRIPSPPLRRWLEDRKTGFHETDQRFAVLFRERLHALSAPLALHLGMWICEGLDTLLILWLLHVDLGVMQVMSFEVVVVLLRSFAFMIPGAIGILDAGYVAFLSAFGVPDAQTVGVAFVLIKRAKELFWILLGYALFVIMKDAPTPAAAART